MILKIDDLVKKFGGLTAVDNLSFGVNEGEILGFIGPNGSGKSTVFNCIMGIYPVTDGHVYFQGEDITDWKTHRIVNSGLARVSQESNPVAGMTVKENIRLCSFPNNVRSLVSFNSGASREEIYEIAAQTGLENDLDEIPGSLAHAPVRRLEFAKALATDPTVMLLDEPFAGMNQAEVRELGEYIEQLRKDGMTIIVVDHNMKGLMEIVDRVVVIDHGQQIATGTPEEIAQNEAVQKAYLAGTGVN